MAQPLPYERDFDFQNFQSGQPSTPLPGDKVNAEFDQIAATLDEVLARIALLQDDDTALKRKSVGPDQLADSLALGFEPPSAWSTAVAYIERDTVFEDGGFYKCLISHTSGAFTTDLAAEKWELIADFTSATADAEAAQAAAEAAQAAAASSASAASTSAGTATTKAAEAAASAATATSKAAEAAGSAGDASASSGTAQAAAVTATTKAGEASDSAAAAAASAASIVVGAPGGAQAYSANLSAVAALAPTDGNFIVADGSTWTVERGSTARTSLGLDYRTLWDFGAVGDGIADDTNAVIDALGYAGIVDLQDGDYRITDPIAVSAAWNFRSNGARILYDGDADAAYVISYIPTGDTNIQGRLIIDGNAKSHKGLYIVNDTDNFYDIIATDLETNNLRKSLISTTADGIWVAGAFDLVHFTRFRADSIVMAAGAGNPGISSARGATVKAQSSTRFPKRVVFENPVVKRVYCEDDTYSSDQDGIGVFSPEDSAMTSALPDTGMQVLINGGSFLDTMGRGVKVQAQKATITNCDIELTRSINYSPSGVSFDCQTGGGTIENITAVFRGAAHRNVALINTPQTSGIKPPAGTVRNIKMLADTSGATVEAVVRVVTRTTDETSFVVEDITAKGPITQLVNINPTADCKVNVSAKRLRGAPVTAFVRGTGANPGAGSIVSIGDVMAEDGTSAPYWALGSSGFTNYTAYTDKQMSSNVDTTADALMKVGAFGLGGITPTWPTSGLNDDTTVGPGVYYSGTVSNRPSGAGGVFISYSRVSDSGAMMVLTSASSTPVGRRWRRLKASGTWGSWLEEPIIGTGNPEGVVTAGVGTLFLRTDGGASTTLYVKESGTGNTGWVAK
jgi:hypothetical protein